MKEIIEGIKVLATKELISANNKFPMFQSTHEGYAVLLEEVEEVVEQLRNVEEVLSYAWGNIRRNRKENTIKCIKELREFAIKMAAESIQVIAMTDKFIDSELNQ